MVHPDLMHHLARSHDRELARTAERERLIAELQPTTPRLQDRVLLAVSDLLIASGTRLRGQRMALPAPHRATSALVPTASAADRLPAFTMQVLRHEEQDAFCLMYYRLGDPRQPARAGMTFFSLTWQPGY